MIEAINRLSGQVDVIYLHILDATQIPGSFFEVEGGPSAIQLQAPIRYLMQNPKVKALGLSSFPTAEKGRELSIKSAMIVFQAALIGLMDRDHK
jgi:arginase family enzyme